MTGRELAYRFVYEGKRAHRVFCSADQVRPFFEISPISYSLSGNA